MLNVLLKEVGQVAIFLICAQTLLHFRAKDSYEKYIKLLISMMLLILLAEPLLDLLSLEEGTSFIEKIQGYEQRIESVMGSSLMSEADIENFLINITTKKVEQGMEYVQSAELAEQEVQQGADADVPVQTQIRIDKIEIGGQNGES